MGSGSVGVSANADEGDADLIHVNTATGPKPQIEPARRIGTEVNGCILRFQLDTGASISLIDPLTWAKIGRPPIRKVSYKPTAYNKSGIPFLGCVMFGFHWMGKRQRRICM